MAKPLILPKITDYWDAAKDAVPTFAEMLRTLPPASALQTASEIQAGVAEHLQVLPETFLARVAFVVAEDLYRAASSLYIWDTAVVDYLTCSAAFFFSTLSQRGLQLHYIIDNSFQELQRPLLLFPEWFRACGIHYECPQLLESQGTPPELSREHAAKGLREAFAHQRHYVYLDADSTHASFETPLEQLKAEGVLTIIREEAPGPGSTAVVFLSGKPINEFRLDS